MSLNAGSCLRCGKHVVFPYRLATGSLIVCRDCNPRNVDAVSIAVRGQAHPDEPPTDPAALLSALAPAPAEGHVQDDPDLRDLSLALAAYIDHYLDAHPDAAPSDMAAGIVEWLSRAGNTLGNGDPGVWGMKVYRNIVERQQAQQEALRLRRDLDDTNRELTAATSLVARQVVRIDRLQDAMTRLRAQLQDATEENLKFRAEMTPQALDRLWSAIVGHPTDQDDDATRGDQQP